MNLNPLFWVNELKEIGRGMKTAGPITDILWCTACFRSPKLLCAFCLYPFCYLLIILLGVRGELPNCANGLTLSENSDSPTTSALSCCAQPPCIMPINPTLWFLSISLPLVHSAYFALPLYFIISPVQNNIQGLELIEGVDVYQTGADMTSSNKMLKVSFFSKMTEDCNIADLFIRDQALRKQEWDEM